MRNQFASIGMLAAVVVVSVAVGFGGGVWFDREPNSQPAAQVVAEAAPAGHEAMDRAHEARVKAFPAKTAGLGGQPITPKIVGGVKVFELTAREVQWEVEPGVKRTAFAYNGQVPGPTIRVTEGDRVCGSCSRTNCPRAQSSTFTG